MLRGRIPGSVVEHYPGARRSTRRNSNSSVACQDSIADLIVLAGLRPEALRRCFTGRQPHDDVTKAASSNARARTHAMQLSILSPHDGHPSPFVPSRLLQYSRTDRSAGAQARHMGTYAMPTLSRPIAYLSPAGPNYPYSGK